MEVSGTHASGSLGRSILLAVTRLALLGGILLGRLESLSAQSATTGAIRARVLDALGHPIRAAEVEIVDAARGLRITLQTDAKGELLAPSLPPAEYHLDITSPGFQPAHISKVLVELGEIARVQTTLPRFVVETSVFVTAEPSSDVDDPPSSTETVISSPELRHLPVDGRRWQSFALLTPQANEGSTSDDVGLLSFRGLAPTQNSSRIDGGDDDQSFNAAPHGSGTDSGPETEEESASEGRSAGESSGRDFSSGSGGGRRPGAEFTFSQAAVQEFRVQGQSYSALYGHAAGGVVTTVSKSGTSTLHGSAFYLVRESAWAATNPFSIVTHYSQGVTTSGVVKPDDRRQQFGGTVGGPLLPKRLSGRLYYFYAFDAQRRSFPGVSSPENPAFYTLTATQHALLGNRGVTSAKIDAALTYLDSLTGTVSRRADQTVNFLKIDGPLNARNHLGAQYNRSRFSSPAGLRSDPVVNRGIRSFGSQNILTDSILTRWLYSRDTVFSNELRLQYSHDLHSEQPQVPLAQEPTIAPDGLSPEIAIGPQGFNFGTPASIGRRAAPDEHRFQVNEIATLVHGRHLLQAGFDYSFVRDFTDSLTNASGTYHYDSGTTNGRAGGLADWITDFTFNVNTYPNGGCPSIHSTIHDFCFRSFSQTFGRQTAIFSTQEFAGFLQDRWRLSEILSLSVGLRYEYELLPIPQRPNGAVDGIFSARGATGVFPEDRNNFGPRIAAAWQPFGQRRGTIRVAYGLYVGRLPGATIRSALVDTGLATSTTRVRILSTTVTGCPQVANQGFGYPCDFTAAPPSGISATTSITVFDRRFRLPVVQQGAFSLERELGHVATMSASYLINLDHQLPNSVDINIAPSVETRTFRIQGGKSTIGVRDGDVFTLPVYTQRVNNSFGPVTAITSNANATYNAMILEARHRSQNSLTFRASWTWSKSIDFGQSSSSVPRTSGQLDPFQIRYDKALSDHNFPHKIVASATWEPKASVSSAFLQHLAAGWLIAPVFSQISGRPYSYNIFGGTRLVGGHESINGSGGSLYLPTVGRNTLRLPHTTNLDFRLSRDLPLSETVHLQAFVEAFNLINHVNYTATTERAFLVGAPANGATPLIYQDAAAIASEGLNSRPFGTLTSSSAQSSKERHLQLGLRVDF